MLLHLLFSRSGITKNSPKISTKKEGVKHLDLKYDESLAKERKGTIDANNKKSKSTKNFCIFMIGIFVLYAITSGCLPDHISTNLEFWIFVSITAILIVITAISMARAFNNIEIEYDFSVKFYNSTSGKTLSELFLDDPYTHDDKTSFKVIAVTVDAESIVSITSVGRVQYIEKTEGVSSPTLDINNACFIVPHKMRKSTHPYSFEDIPLHWENPDLKN